MEIIPNYYSYNWLKFRGAPQQDFKQQSKFDDKECCAERHEPKHKGKIFYEA